MRKLNAILGLMGSLTALAITPNAFTSHYTNMMGGAQSVKCNMGSDGTSSLIVSTSSIILADPKSNDSATLALVVSADGKKFLIETILADVPDNGEKIAPDALRPTLLNGEKLNPDGSVNIADPEEITLEVNSSADSTNTFSPAALFIGGSKQSSSSLACQLLFAG